MNLIEKYVLPGKKMALFFYIRGRFIILCPVSGSMPVAEGCCVTGRSVLMQTISDGAATFIAVLKSLARYRRKRVSRLKM